MTALLIADVQEPIEVLIAGVILLLVILLLLEVFKQEQL